MGTKKSGKRKNKSKSSAKKNSLKKVTAISPMLPKSYSAKRREEIRKKEYCILTSVVK